MIDLVVRKTNKTDANKEYVLMVREYHGIEVEWYTLCYMDAFSANRLIGEKVTLWENTPIEEEDDNKSLRLKHPTLREAWDNYRTLKALFKSS